jgi:AbrB family looped-hinge helix DNA binding protein
VLRRNSTERAPSPSFDITRPVGCTRMMTITISPKFQIEIPKASRDLLGLRPGQKVHAIVYEDRIELIPIRRMKEMRGFLRGIDTSVDREAGRV